MDFTIQFVLLILCSSWYRLFLECVAVNIRRLEVPPLVEVGTDSVVLDCEYDPGPVVQAKELVLKWFYNGSSGMVYQWIPPRQPQVIGLLKGKVDLDFRISEEPLQKFRAIRILKPSTDLSGNYTCVVSTYKGEDKHTKSMLVYSTGRNFQFYQEKKYVFLVTVICSAEKLYPKPVIDILSRGKSLPQTMRETKMDSWGLYEVKATAVVHDDNCTSPFEEFICTLTLPGANYTVNRTTIYYPGFMPTVFIAASEMERHQERQTNNGRAFTSDTLYMFYLVLLAFHAKTCCHLFLL